MAIEYRSYDVISGKHGTSQEEWAPHVPQTEKTFEWWYITNILDNEKGEKLFQHVILFHFAGANYLQALKLDRNAGPGHYLISLAVSDYARKLRISDKTFAKVENSFDRKTNTMKFDGKNILLEWAYQGDKMIINGKSPRQNVKLTLFDKTGILWNRDKMGIPGLIGESSPDEPSFYYSIPTLEAEGTLVYTGEDGKEIKTGVNGQGWCDRQWGDYMTKTWEWCSMRFFDGDRVNLYAFPQTGHKVGALMKKDGKTEYFDNFTVQQKGYFETPNGVWLACDWEYELPIKQKKYRVTSASQKDIDGITQTFLETMGFIYDDKNQHVGYTANESMDLKVTGTGPYKNKI